MTINEIYRKSLWFQLFLASIVGILVHNAFTYAEDAEEWMPDAALRVAVREELGLPAAASLMKTDATDFDSISEGQRHF